MQRIVIVGAGTMGHGIAQVFAMGNFETTLQDVSSQALEKAEKAIQENLEAGIKLGKVTEAQKKMALQNLHFSPELEKAAQNADAIIEAVPEDLTLKCDLFKKLHGVAPKHCVFATNTSALPIGEMAEASGRPDRFIGMHFFNPVHKMKLVEVIRAKTTSDETTKFALAVVQQIGKESVEVREAPGFVTSRMNALIGNEAFRMLEEGVASAKDIDKAIKLGLNHPMGPFEMVDLVGLDVRLSILRYLSKTLGERFRPSSLLEKWVVEGRLGKKVGRGVYEYDTQKVS